MRRGRSGSTELFKSLVGEYGVPTMGGFNGWYPEVIQVNQSPKGQPPYQINVNSTTAGVIPPQSLGRSGRRLRRLPAV